MSSFKRVKVEEKKISANYERGLWKDVLISIKENKTGYGLYSYFVDCYYFSCGSTIMSVLIPMRRI